MSFNSPQHPIYSYTERKEEEKEDLWKLWNEMRQDKPAEQPVIAKSPIHERENGQKGPKKMNFTSSNHSIAESIARMNAANVNVHNGYTTNSYADNNHQHVTKPSATETISKESAAAPASYSYNNNRYDYADPAPLVNKLPTVGSASQLRYVKMFVCMLIVHVFVCITFVCAMQTCWSRLH